MGVTERCERPGLTCGAEVIHNSGILTLERCTLTRNSSGTVTLTHSIVAGNSSPTGPDISNTNTLNRSGVNFIGDLGGTTLTASSTLLTTAQNGSIALAPLGNYGGPTQTRALLPGSPARNASSGSGATIDQRGFPIVGTPDIGAYEAQIGPIAATTTNEDTATGAIAFTVGTVGTLSASSSNTTLVPNANLTLGGSGANRSLSATPALNQNGSTTLTLTDNLSGETQTFLLTVNAVNDAPSFTKGANQTRSAASGAQSIAGWATALNDGDPGVTQTLSFTVTNDNNALFTAQPAVAANGTLTFTPSGSTGSATVSVSIQDDGGTLNGGQNSSAVQTFTITLTLSTVISSTGDTGPGTLRQAVLDAALLPGTDTLTFAPGFTGPITLSNNEIILTSSVTLDGGSNGLTIDGGSGTNRIFTVNSGQTVTLRNLTLTGGNATGATDSGIGGAIHNSGTLTLERCTLTGNSSTLGGGALRNYGTLTSDRCTFSGNTGTSGGVIFNTGSALFVHCTLTGNTATSQGGAIRNSSGTVTLTHSIVAGNSSPTGPDISNTNTLNRSGVNFVGDLGGTTLTASSTLLTTAQNGSIALAPLGSYGGPTQTHALMPGSPARNAATGSTITSDQRGFPIVGVRDIGAYEAGTFNSYTTYIWETLPAAATTPQRATTFDFDGDGQTNEQEWLALTDAASGSSTFRVTQTAHSGNTFSVTFPTALGRTYQLQSSPNLANPWTNVGSATAGTGGNVTLQVDVTGFTSRFFRVSVSAP